MSVGIAYSLSLLRFMLGMHATVDFSRITVSGTVLNETLPDGHYYHYIVNRCECTALQIKSVRQSPTYISSITRRNAECMSADQNYSY